MGRLDNILNQHKKIHGYKISSATMQCEIINRINKGQSDEEILEFLDNEEKIFASEEFQKQFISHLVQLANCY